MGRYLSGVPGRTEPSLVDPELPVVPERRVPIEEDLGPAPAYHLLSPATRGAYLHWLAGGRRTDVPAGLVLLFCFGLERRVLHDAGHDPAVRDELPAIAAEVLRLRQRYGRDAPELSDGLERLLDLLDVLGAPRRAPGPACSASTGSTVGLRVALARFAASAMPVPVEWARAWARHHPLLAPPGVQAQCPQEFDRLFTLRYRDTFGPGLVPPDDMPGLRIRYRPANPELSTTLVCREDLPDVLAEPRSGRALGALIDGIAGALDPYRRMVTRFPRSRGSLAATTLLPTDLLDPDHGRFGALRVWTEARFNGCALAVVDGAEFAAFWPTASPGRMARDEAAAFIEVLALLGVGVEPDVRFGAPALGPGSAVLFRSGAPVWQRPAGIRPAGTPAHARGGTAEADRPGPGFAAAATIARCAAALVEAGAVVPHGG
ncbi:MAG TPA: TerB N-terminal domain-containing protein, partial [Actinoplanes sp.]|nr:TerB N-terminal domain-containing protein [Actinoplanes sp.]